MSKTRWDFVSKDVRDELGKLPKTHRNMIDVTEKIFGKGRGVARPGKTAHEAHRRAGKPKAVPKHQQRSVK